jgi:hypothetical protein
MSTDSIAARSIPCSAREPARALMAARIGLMAAMEASLQISRKAVLALDLAQIERQTDEQADLVRRLAELLRPGALAETCDSDAFDEARPAAFVSKSRLEDERELRRKADRIMEPARLQAALLARAQRKLRVLAALLAGPVLTYGPFEGREAAATRHRSGVGEKDPIHVGS